MLWQALLQKDVELLQWTISEVAATPATPIPIPARRTAARGQARRLVFVRTPGAACTAESDPGSPGERPAAAVFTSMAMLS
jgi:hypothetical protein